MSGKIKNLQYWSLFAVESAGMGLILSMGIPLYRRLFDEPLKSHPGRAVILPVLGVAAVVQASYWGKYRLRPAPAKADHPFLGHLLLFLLPLSFIFAGSLLSPALSKRLTDIRESFPGVAVLLFATFAQFCSSRELETLARRVGVGSAPTPPRP